MNVRLSVLPSGCTGGRSQSRDHACCPWLCPRLQGAGSVGSTPSSVLPAAPPPGGGPSACSSGRTRSAAGLWLKPEDSASWESVQTEGYVAGRCASVQAVHSSADDSVSGYLGSVHSHETSDISTCEHNRRAGDSLFINQSFGKR